MKIPAALPLALLACVLAQPGAVADDLVSTRAATSDKTFFAPPVGFVATLVENAHIDLRWENRAIEDGGNFLEFNLGQEQEFSILDLLLHDTTLIRHPDVARGTRFNYRLTPFFGRISNIVIITTGDATTATSALREFDGPLGEISPTAGLSMPHAKLFSLRGPQTFAAAAPADLTVQLASPTTIDLRWRDHASDEDGYLLQISTDGGKQWWICAYLPPNTVSFRKTRLPPKTEVRFAVRAYFRGQSSAVASVVTPPR